MLFLQDGPPVATAAIPGRPPKDHPGYPQILYHELEGKLFTYVRVPRDAVLQMAECVPTADLVEMSRTDAAFCQLLMEPDVAHLWKDAWRNVEGAPECPPYMEDMVYAVLLYSDRCRRCGEARESSVVFEWQIRYCVQCKSEKTRNVTEEKEYIREIMDETGVEDLLCVVDDHLHIPELDAFRECWNGLSEDKEARKELAEESAKNVALRKEAAKKYREWRTDGQGTRPRSDNVGIGWERFKLIRKGIDAEDVVLFRDEFAWRHCVDEATERTDCNTRIKAGSSQPGLSGGTPMDCAYILPATFEFLYLKWTEDFLLPRVEVFHLQIVQTWAEVWDPDECSPDDPQAFKRLRPADFLAFLEVKWNLTAQPGDTLFMEVREMTSEKLSGMVERWYDDRRTDLNELFKEAMPDFAAENDVVPVELAVCMFDCVDPRCGARFMHYPAVLDHRCRRISIAPAKTAAYDIVVQEYMSRQREPPAWNKTSVRISLVICGGRAEAIVRACGLDPKNATPEDLHKTGARMTCADCRDKGIESEFGIEVFDWQRALYHQTGEHHVHDTKACQWVTLPNEYAEKVRNFEDKLRTSPAARIYEQRGWRCKCETPCDTFYSYEALLNHIHSTHNVEDEVRHKIHYDSRIISLPNDLQHGTFIRFLKQGRLEVLSKYERSTRATNKERRPGCKKQRG